MNDCTLPKKLKALLSSSANVATTYSDSDSNSETIHILRVAIASITNRRLTPPTNIAFSVDNLSNKWIVNSGASRTMCSHRNWFQTFTPFLKPTQVILGDNTVVPSLLLALVVFMFACLLTANGTSLLFMMCCSSLTSMETYSLSHKLSNMVLRSAFLAKSAKFSVS